MKFGVREICDVVFKTTTNNQRVGGKTYAKAGMPVFMIDTARTSTLEQTTTTVYANGGRGYSRLIAWEGERVVTFTVEDALMSPMGLALLTGAGLINPSKDKPQHFHITINLPTDANGIAEINLETLREETYLFDASKFTICNVDAAVTPYATGLDDSEGVVQFYDDVKWMKKTVSESGVVSYTEDTSDYIDVTEAKPAYAQIGYKQANNLTATAVNISVQLDFYILMTRNVIQVEIKPSDFGGFYYVEAQTLFRREDNGKDMAAEIIFPKVKIQSAFTFTMAASGDPSVFNFTMDVFPGYTKFDRTKKVLTAIQIIGETVGRQGKEADHRDSYNEDTPDFL